MQPKWRVSRTGNFIVNYIKDSINAIDPGLLSKNRKNQPKTIEPYQKAIDLLFDLAKCQNLKYGYLFEHYRLRLDLRAFKRCPYEQYFEFMMSLKTIPTSYEMANYIKIITEPTRIDLTLHSDIIDLNLMQFAQDNLNLIVPSYLKIIKSKSVQGLITADEGWLTFLLVDAQESLPDKFPVTAKINDRVYLFDVYLAKVDELA